MVFGISALCSNGDRVSFRPKGEIYRFKQKACGLLLSKREIINNLIILIADHHSIAFKFDCAASEVEVFMPVYEGWQYHKVYSIL